MYDKEKLFRFRRVSKVNIYNIGYYEDYFYGYMADHAGYVKYFDLKLTMKVLFWNFQQEKIRL